MLEGFNSYKSSSDFGWRWGRGIVSKEKNVLLKIK
jgi:hypothetical protein